MIERYKDGSVAWIDLLSPSQDETREAMDECRIPPELMTDMTAPVPRSGATSSDGVLKVTLDFPVVKRTDIESPHEIKFIVTKKALVTARYEDITAVYKFGKEFEVLSILQKPAADVSGGHLFIALMSFLYESLTGKLDYMESRLLDIEKEIFNQKEKEMVFEISKVSQRLIVFKQTLMSHREILTDVSPLLVELFGTSLKKESNTLTDHLYHLLRRVASLSDSLEELRNTNNSLLNTKQNEIMKTLTIMAFITFPLTLMTSMFGMNTETLPIVGSRGDFWIILGMMGVATAGFFVFFKYKRWI